MEVCIYEPPVCSLTAACRWLFFIDDGTLNNQIKCYKINDIEMIDKYTDYRYIIFNDISINDISLNDMRLRRRALCLERILSILSS